jgi:hypothetical protein
MRNFLPVKGLDSPFRDARGCPFYVTFFSLSFALVFCCTHCSLIRFIHCIFVRVTSFPTSCVTYHHTVRVSFNRNYNMTRILVVTNSVCSTTMERTNEVARSAFTKDGFFATGIGLRGTRRLVTNRSDSSQLGAFPGCAQELYTLLCVSMNGVCIGTRSLRRSVLLGGFPKPYFVMTAARHRLAKAIPPPLALGLPVLKLSVSPQRLCYICNPFSPSRAQVVFGPESIDTFPTSFVLAVMSP